MVDSRIPIHLAALARANGIELEFVDATGVRRRADPDLLRRVLSALGRAAGNEVEARDSLRRELEGRRAVRLRRTPQGSGRRTPQGSWRRTPQGSCLPPKGQAFGVLTNLYSVRPTCDRGFGDLGALRECVLAAARAQLDFVGVNPLHALRNTRQDSSPYYPTSRLFRSELYLDVTAAPEFQDQTVRRVADSVPARRRRAASSRAEQLDYDALRIAQRRVLLAMFDAFERKDSPPDRRRRFAKFVTDAGSDLEGFATFVAAEEEFGRERAAWPSGLGNGDPAAVRRFRATHRRSIDFHCWVQFELERQWMEISQLARDARMRVGLYTDLAIGSAPDSADVWAQPSAFVREFSLGAPPDGYAREGQVWNFPPLHPGEIERSHGAYFRKLLRAAMLGAGAVRIDHAIGLVRQYWVPVGEPGTRGVMVRMPSRTLFDVIAQESRRNHCIVVAEDLGTLPKELPGLLEKYRLLSSRVMMFCRDRRGEFQDPRRYPKRALATFGTHDLPPFRGFIAGTDLSVRQRLGLLSKRALGAAQRARRAEIGALERRVRATSGSPGADDLSIADIHSALARSPCALIGMSLDDLAGETAPVNVPGITSDRHPVWSRRMQRTIDEIEIPSVDRLAPKRRQPEA